jgi:DNA repair protein RadD
MTTTHEHRWYQEEAIQSLFDFFANTPGFDNQGKPVRANPLICMPTGTGKSHVIGGFIKRAMITYRGTRVFMATHVKELIKQNAAKLTEAWPLAPLGIYSAGLKSRDTMQPIIFGGVQSSVGKFPLFGKRDLLIVDEAHLISPTADTSYVKFINELTGTAEGIPANSPNVNPYLKVIGLTATAYRMGLGCMTNGPIFSHIAYNICTIDGFNRLIAEGYLCPLIPKRTQTQLDTSKVGLQNGEFAAGALQNAVDKNEITYAALSEVVNEGIDRKSWLLFASGVEHAEHICEMLNTAFGISCVAIHSKKTDAENEASLEAWKSGKVRAAVNMNSLTTGVDHPACDLIAMLRPTMSTGLWVQMLGRGTRPYPGKVNCLVLDFAGNTRRLGPINDPVIPKKKGEGPPGDAPVKVCKHCGTYNHISAKECIVCGEEFPIQEKLNTQASNLELIRSDLPQIETFEVQRVILTPHTSKNSGKDSIKVSYYCKGAIPRTFYEYISVETTSRFFLHKSKEWFRQRYHYRDGIEHFNEKWDGDVPKTNKDVLDLSNELRIPTSIRIWVNRPTPELMGYNF